jgi:hypothetical protein
MSEFLVVVGDGPRAESWFERGLRAAERAGAGAPGREIRGTRVRVAAWPRRAKPGLAAASSGRRWLIASGSWFADDGTQVGDEAALLRALSDRGAEAVASGLEGFFALVFGDDHEATIVTEPIGSRHVYVRDGDGVTAAGTSALVLAALDDTALDPIGCQEFLATGVMYEDRTPYAAVRALPPASVVALDAGRWRVSARSWSIRRLQPETLDAGEAVEAFGSAMLAVGRRLARAFARPVADLTAGWDSRILCAFLRGSAVSFETTVTGTDDEPDVVLSTRIAERLGLRHLVIPAGAAPDFDEILRSLTLTDGLCNALGYARVYRVHRELAQRFDASLNGSFGEVARGYWWELLGPAPAASAPLDAEHIARRRYAAGAPTLALWPTAERIEPVPHFAGVLRRLDGELADAPLSFRLDRAYLRMRMRCWQGRIASSTDRLWPCLSPLIFRSALEPLLRTKADARLRNRFARRVLARFAPDLARLPLESGGPALPMTPWNAWRFLPEAFGFAGKVVRKLTGHRTYARTLEETAAPRLALWRDDCVRDALDPQRMELSAHVDRGALAGLLAATRAPEFEHELVFGNLLALELGLRRLRTLRHG